MLIPNNHTTVRELLDHYTCVAKVFFERKMRRVGCPTETFHTIEKVAGIYGYPLEDLLQDIYEAIKT